MQKGKTQKEKRGEADIRYFQKNLLNALKVEIPDELMKALNEDDSLYERIDKESVNFDSKVQHAIDHLTMAQAIMFEEFEGRDVEGIYSEFDDLIEHIQKYHFGE
jgi:uncharacterized protein YpuA (DUF1002 family)